MEFVAQVIYSAVEYGFLQGYQDGTVRPFKAVTRAEAWKIILETFYIIPADYVPPAASRFTDVNPGYWYYRYVTYVEQNYELDATDLFDPEGMITRGELANIFSMVLVKAYPDFYPILYSTP